MWVRTAGKIPSSTTSDIDRVGQGREGAVGMSRGIIIPEGGGASRKGYGYEAGERAHPCLMAQMVVDYGGGLLGPQ